MLYYPLSCLGILFAWGVFLYVVRLDTFWAAASVIVPMYGCFLAGAVAGLVGIECGVVSGVINLESSGVEASDWRPRHDEHYHEA